MLHETPSEEKPQAQTVFDKCVSRLATTIAFEDAEKLSLLMRDTVSWLLGTLAINNNQPINPVEEDKLSFRAQLLAPPPTIFEMHFYGDAEREEGSTIAIMRFRDGYYMGLPDNVKPQPSEKLPPFVHRRRIYATGFRRNSSRSWSKLGKSASELKLDFQIG